jgi:hypothetical protein
MKLLVILLSLFASWVWAQEEKGNQVEPSSAEGAMKLENSSEEPTAEGMRDPASDIPGKKGTDEELRVRNQLPDAVTKKDARSLQSEVYKQIYNRELKPDQREDVLDE